MCVTICPGEEEREKESERHEPSTEVEPFPGITELSVHVSDSTICRANGVGPRGRLGRSGLILNILSLTSHSTTEESDVCADQL